MRVWIFTAVYVTSSALFSQTYAGFGFGVSSGAGIYVEHFIVPNWSVEANLGIPAVGFGVNRTVYRKSETVRTLFSRKNKPLKERTSGRVSLGGSINAGIIPDVGLFQYGFFNIGLHKVARKTDFGMELGWMLGNIVNGPPSGIYPQAFSWPGVQFSIGRSLFEPGPLKRFKQRALTL